MKMPAMPDLNEFQKSDIVGMKSPATTPATFKRSIHRVEKPVTLTTWHRIRLTI